jgi:hypothetical protein
MGEGDGAEIFIAAFGKVFRISDFKENKHLRMYPVQKVLLYFYGPSKKVFIW